MFSVLGTPLAVLVSQHPQIVSVPALLSDPPIVLKPYFALLKGSASSQKNLGPEGRANDFLKIATI
jgi:hypothetical protein